MKVEIDIGHPRPTSHSQFDLHTGCPKRFQLQKIVKVPEQPAVYFASGNTVHALTAVLDLLEALGATYEEALAKAMRFAETSGLEYAVQKLTGQVKDDDDSDPAEA